MKIALTLGVVCFVICAAWAGPVQPIRIGNQTEWSLSQSAYLYTTPQKLSPQQAFASIRQVRLAAIKQEHINLGLQAGYVWLYFRLANEGAAKTVLFTLDRIDIHYVQAFRQRGRAIDTLALTGDALPFSSRPVRLNYFAIPVKMAAHEEADILILLEKKNEYISGNIGLYSASQFLQKVRTDSAVVAFFLGIAAFIFLFNFFLWFSLDDSVHLLFMAHQVAIVSFVLINLGYGFEFLWPTFTYSNSLIMTMVSGIWASTNLFLIKKYLNLTATSSRFYRVVHWLAWYILIVSIVGCSLSLLRPASVPAYILKLGLSLLLIWIIANAIVLVSVFVEQVGKRNQAAYIYVAALSFMLISSVVYTLTLLNVINAGSYTTDWLIPSFLWEETILAFGLTVRYNRFRQQYFTLQLSLAHEQTRTNEAIIQAQESERQRIAADLHDDLGGTLATIRRRLTDIRQHLRDPQAAHELDALEPLIRQSSHDLRRIAHNLMPPEFARIGLRAALEQLVQSQPSQPTRFSFVVAGSEYRLATDVELNLYRIVSELIQNINKHAQAARTAVQLLYHNDHLTIMVEDDGLGSRAVANEGNKPGLGLTSSQLRAEYIGAQLWREVSLGGTLVMIDVPYATATHTLRTEPKQANESMSVT
ncbi:hypothetical protein F5984_17400 [Rudanella paleaurantiibacter]|uniref:Histidine kinase n=1 Tax=Rudanella paleaurantiibacter TaxID=2614655 RepID=A0A7J5TW03_9BACT|nr:7TM diverse intracellular signaling domain-containing protein [Rudanella paleaurantiibacter]KAB7728617.1 hypothetical protein F5984_17400 [Rudanella paleaurantiibacter]